MLDYGVISVSTQFFCTLIQLFVWNLKARLFLIQTFELFILLSIEERITKSKEKFPKVSNLCFRIGTKVLDEFFPCLVLKVSKLIIKISKMNYYCLVLSKILFTVNVKTVISSLVSCPWGQGGCQKKQKTSRNSNF